jgi:hypothetical protein
MKLGHGISKDRASLVSKKYNYISIAYIHITETAGVPTAPPFLPGGKICRFAALRMSRCMIASREYGLY